MNKSDKFWDGAAARYAKSRIADDATYQRKLAETQQLLTKNMRILELGCGTGTTAVHHAPHVAHIDAIDISEKMLALGRERAQAAGIENIDFTRATLHDFRAASASKDAVLALNVLHLIANRRATITEAARILRPGGVFVTSTACVGSSYLRFARLIVPLGKLLGLMPDFFVISEAQLAKEIEDAGFVIEQQWHHGRQDIAVFMVARKVGA